MTTSTVTPTPEVKPAEVTAEVTAEAPAPTPTLTNAKPLAALTAEQRKQRFNELRLRMGKSRLEVKGKAGIHYFWADKTNDSEIIRLEGSADYTIVREPDPKEVLAGKKKPTISASGLKEDGTYVVGDVILMQCPQENYEFQLLTQDENMREAKESVKENFISNAGQQGVPVFEAPQLRKK